MKEITAILDDEPPRDKRAEMQLLCCCLLDPRLAARVSVDWFYESGLGRVIFEHLVEAIEDSDGDDATRLLMRRVVFGREGFLNKHSVNPAFILAKILQSGARVVQFDEYVRACRKAVEYRERLLRAAMELREAAYEWQQYKHVLGE